MGLEFSVVPEFSGFLLLGAWWTFVCTVAGGAMSFAGGIALALISLYAHWAVRLPIKFIAWLVMGTPLLLQLFLLYFGLVQVGVDIPALAAGIIGLGVHFAVYNSDIIQAGIKAVDNGQYEAARTLGLSRYRAFRYIVVPQAVRDVIPPIGNNMIALLKDSALVSVIGVAELVHASQLAISETFRPFEFYITAAVLYYVINLALEMGLRHVERKVQAAR